MNNSFALPRRLIILAIVLPIAAVVGYQLAEPSLRSFALIGALATVLSIPVFLRWHHPLLIFSWNAAVQIFFLPGQPELWMLFAGISLILSVLNRLLLKEDSQTYVPSVVWPLIFLSLVVAVTAKLTGGIGLRVLGGSSYGGRRYVFYAAAVVGYFALTGRRIPIPKAGLYSGLFFLSSITAAMGNLLYVLGPSFWFLYAVFPVGGVVGYQTDFTGTGLVRLGGLTLAGGGVCQFMLCRFGIRGLFVVSKSWRLFGFLVALFMILLGGFRSALLAMGILFVFQFFLEGLHRTRLAIVLPLAIVVGSAVVVPFATKMPLSVQRTLAFLPIKVNPVAKSDALGSTEWRVRMWQVLWPEVPKYLLLGKGCSLNPSDLYLAQEAMLRGQAQDFEGAMVAGDYHNGLLALVIQFGIWGVLGFFWFALASLRVLFRNYRYSPPELKLCNTFLVAFFATQLLCFFFSFGSFAERFCVFTGIVGLSVSLNGGMRMESATKVGPFAG